MKYQTYKTGARLYEIPFFVDDRGALNVLEIAKELPFPCKRIFYTYSVPEGSVRGEHAHKTCEEFLIAIRGSLEVLVDDGVQRDSIVLDTPSKGLHLPAGCCGEQRQHSDDCILLVLASAPYCGEDYIRNYEDFLNWKNTPKR